MFILQKITIQSGVKIFTPKSKMLLRIQFNNSVVKTQEPAKIINSTSLTWQQLIQVPQVYDTDMHFEVYQRHQFGYNPQEFEKILHGTMSFTKGNEKYNNWQIYDNTQKKIGYLSVNIKPKNASISDSKIISSPRGKQSQIVTISSIVVNIQGMKTKKAYAVISIGSDRLKTQISKSRSGQLVFVQKYQLNKDEDIDEGLIEIITVNAQQSESKIATAIVKLQNRINRKLKFCDEQGNFVGQGFIDGKVQMKSDALAEKMLSGLIKNSFQKQKNISDNTSTFKDLSKSILSHRSFARSPNHSSLDLSQSRNRVSIVNGNTNIKFSQQKRFHMNRDTNNPKCSYLPERDFDLKEKRVGKYYKGASIGYGGKVNLIGEKKSLPGVGKYTLPSIWDRY